MARLTMQERRSILSGPDHTTDAPKGISDSFAILKHCFPMDTKECYAPETAKNDIADRHFKAEEYDPDQVHQKGKPAAPIYDLFSEREKGETRELEALQSDGNTDDGHTPQASGQHPRKSADQSTKQKPENIADHCHIPFPFRFSFRIVFNSPCRNRLPLV